MKKTVYGFLVAFCILFMACGRKASTTGGVDPIINPPVVTVSPKIILSKGSIVNDGFETTTIKVVNTVNSQDITSQCAVLLAGQPLATNEFSSETVGAYNLTAKYNTTVDATPATITVVDKGPSKYSQKVLAEDFTGAWCGYCPRVAYKLDAAHAANPNVIISAVHNADAFAYSFEGQMRSKYGVTGFPTAILNRDIKWDENSAIFAPLTSKWSILGLAIESTVSGTTISGKIKTEYNVTTALPMTITVMLQEDGKVLAQTNYFNATTGNPFFGLGNPIPNYVHNNILRVASTDIFGETVPTASQAKGSIYEKAFSFNAANYNIANCRIVAIVSWADGVANRKGVINAQAVKAGQNKNFD